MNDFAVIYEQERPGLFAYLLKASKDWHLAEDLTSTVFEVAWREREKWEDRGIPYSHYLRRIAYWHFGLHWKKEYRWRRIMHRYPYLHQHLLDDATGDDGGIQAVLDRCETAMFYALLRAALPRLRPRPLRAIVLRYGLGLPEKEAARRMGIGLDAYRSCRRAAEERLQQLILGKEPKWTAKNAKKRTARSSQ